LTLLIIVVIYRKPSQKQFNGYSLSVKMCAISNVWDVNGYLSTLHNSQSQALYYGEGNSVFVKDPLCHSQKLFNCMKKDAPEMYKCNYCSFEGFLKVNLKIHMEIFHKAKNREFSLENFRSFSDTNYNMSNILKCHSCTSCDFSTFSSLLFMKHNLENHDITPKVIKNKPPPRRQYNRYRVFTGVKSFECNQCPVKTTAAYAMMKHIRAMHGFPEEVQIFDCKQCPFKTPHEGNFKNHMKRHVENDSSEWLECDQCSYKTKHRNYLERHTKANHTALEDIKWFPCDHCPYKSKNKWVLKDHVIARHTPPEDINWLLCELCAYKCKHKRNLKQHIRGKHKIKL
jgi:hypothetical protein